MKTFPHIFSIFLFLCIGKPLFAQSSLSSYFVQSPCPVDGVPVTEFTDTLYNDSAIKRYPVSGTNCTHSSIRTAYKEFRFINHTSSPLPIKLSGTDVRVDIYKIEYVPSNPCFNLLKSITSSDWDTLQTVAGVEQFVLVVSSLAPVDSFSHFSIQFGREIGRIPDKCMFTCEEFGEGLKNFPKEPLDIQITKPYNLKEDLQFYSSTCWYGAFRTHQFSSQDSNFSVQSHYVQKPRLIETIFDLEPLVLNCDINDFTLQGILQHLSQKYQPHEIDEFKRLVATLEAPICPAGAFVSAYTFIGLNKVLENESSVFQIKCQMIDWCSPTAYEYTQDFVVRRTEQQLDTIRFEDKVGVANSFNCTHAFRFPEPEGYSGCVSNAPNYVVNGNIPVVWKNGRYEAELPVGTHVFEYQIYDCCHKTPIIGSIEIKVFSPGLITSFIDKFGLNSASVLVPEEYFFLYTNHPCYGIKSRITHSSSKCGPVTDNKVPLCCEDIEVLNDSLIGYGLVTLTGEIDIDVSNDGVFGNENDNKVISEINFILYDVVKEIQCPGDLVLPCTTSDISTEVTGSAVVLATCYPNYIPRHLDLTTTISPDITRITRVFRFTDAFKTHSCEQKITLDCTVSNEDVMGSAKGLHVSPNPLVGNGVFTFWSSSNHDAVFEIYSPAGHLVYEQFVQLIPGENQINFHADFLPGSGLYLAQIKTKHETYQAKVITLE